MILRDLLVVVKEPVYTVNVKEKKTGAVLESWFVDHDREFKDNFKEFNYYYEADAYNLLRAHKSAKVLDVFTRDGEFVINVQFAG